MKKIFFRLTSLILSIMTLTSPINAYAFEYELDGNNDSIEFVEYQSSDSDDFTNETNVYAMIASEYQVTIPKTIVLSGDNKSANYNVNVSGDIAGYETVFVKPDTSVLLNAINKESVRALISQDKTSWKYSEFDIAGVGSIDASNITAGRWTGSFNFNIGLDNESAETVQLDNGRIELTKINEQNLINEIINLGEISDSSQIDKFYEAKAIGDVTFPVTLTFDVDANDGDRIAIYHHNGNNWEYIALATAIDGKVSATFSSFSPIMVVNRTKHGLFSGPGLYNEGNGLTYSWDELVQKGLRISTDYTVLNYNRSNTSGYSVLEKNNLGGKLIIPDSVNKISNFAFYGCKGLTSIEFGNSIKSTGRYSLQYCENLKTAIVSDSLTDLGEGTFSHCFNLTTIKLGNSVKSIGRYAFAHCTSLTSLVLPDSVEKIDNYVFLDCPNLTFVTYKGVKYTDKTAFNNKVIADKVATSAIWE